MNIRRRDFLKIFGLAGTTSAVGGCSKTAQTLIPYVIPPEDIVPGMPTWYATTCRACPAGCGVLAKNRDGRIIKAEGNPLHPISRGKLCPRGQASLQGLYNPDRFQQPARRNADGVLEPITWEQGEKLLVDKLRKILEVQRGDRVVFISELSTGTLNELMKLWLLELGQLSGPTLYEPYAYEPLRAANRMVFNYDAIPHYRIHQADFLISFGANFLETWLSNLEYARQFAQFRHVSKGEKQPFIYVGPRLSITANNADLWIPTLPGTEFAVGLGMLRVLLDDKLPGDGLSPEQAAYLRSITAQWPLEKVESVTGVNRDLIVRTAHRFAASKAPLAVAEGLPLCPHAKETAVVANLLCTLRPGTGAAIDFSSIQAHTHAARLETLRDIDDRMHRGHIDLLLIHNANPVFALPGSWNFRDSINRVPMVVSFSSVVDETTSLAHLILPTHTAYESWGDHIPRSGVSCLLQATMGTVFDTRHLGDILLSTGRVLKGSGAFPWNSFYELLKASWHTKWEKMGEGIPFEVFWQQAILRGGSWSSQEPPQTPVPFVDAALRFPQPEVFAKPEGSFSLAVYPTIQFYDGREANRPWIQEFPDPITQVTWGGWVEIDAQTARSLQIHKGDILRLKSPFGTVEAPALPTLTVPPQTLAMPIGQGHTQFGRYASGLPGNPLGLLNSEIDPGTGELLLPPFRVHIEKTDQKYPIANTDGSFFASDPHMIQSITPAQYRKQVEEGQKPSIDLPLPEGYRPEKDIYPPHEHKDYRWVMVVDMDRCIGCGACVVACYAENNLSIVGRRQMLKQREMSWIRVQRYFEGPDLKKARWLIMLCQHCDEAPCEAVCPIFAPHHSKEGLNNQVYNRCFGTRFCSQNDPYKVRRFNFYTYTREKPLDMQLNPDVTVRQKGVMEKCSFCIQRIAEAKIRARELGRLVQDGDFTTACAQTCPTDALVFGSLLDPNSRVSKLIKDPRAYQVFQHLNTKPAVIYMKKIMNAD